MKERNWWVRLVCRWWAKRVKVTAGDGTFHYGLSDGGRWAEHYACREERKP
jgi:hypothetical protein